MTHQSLIHCQLWMGCLEAYMSEGFLMSAFQRMGEQPQNVKVMRNKYTGEPAGYCFVHFATDDEAINAMHKLNGKLIPKSQPPVRFKLNHAGSTGRPLPERDFSLWVGDLTAEVDDYTLYKTFAARFQSIRAAKVIMDSSGFSKGYGFVRFAKESEQRLCLDVMNGYRGLGGKPLKISNAVPKSHRLQNMHSPPLPGSSSCAMNDGYSPGYVMSGSEYVTYYEPSYWSESASWQGSYYDYGGSSGDCAGHEYLPPEYYSILPMEELEPVDHSQPLDVDGHNLDVMRQDSSLWDDLEASRWMDPQEFKEHLDLEAGLPLDEKDLTHSLAK